MSFQAHVLRLEVEAATEIHLRQHKGSALRGAFLHALRTDFCTNPGFSSCRPCSVRSSCPVCFLVSTTDDDSSRGVDAPRPCVIEPPIDARQVYYPGDRLDFNVVLFSRALSLFPYVIVAARRMGELGLGTTRGKFSLREIWAVEPLAGLQQRVLRQGDNLVKVPNIPVDHDQVVEMAASLSHPLAPNPSTLSPQPSTLAPIPSPHIKLRFKTPLRLVTKGELVHNVSFATLMRRLLERLSILWSAYAEEPLTLNFAALLAQAEQVRLVEDNTRWMELDRYSSRQQRRMPMGGLIGEITLEGDLTPFLPWLIWGSIVHVGKYAVLGNGWYELSRE